MSATRGVALTLTLAASSAFLTQAAVAAAPTAGSNGPTAEAAKKFLPRQVFRKNDPVQMLLPKKLRGAGLLPTLEGLTGEFVVKFRDDVKARVSHSGASLSSHAGADLSDAQAIIERYEGVARQWIRKSESELASIEMRARAHSGREQPDLAGMIVVSGVRPENLFDAASALNALGDVEFISIQRQIHNLQEGCDPNNPADCNVPSPTCTEEFPGNGDGILRTECNPDPDADPLPYGCNDVACCNQVGQIDPTCIDEADTGGWDVYCAAWANLLCTGTIYEPAPDTGPYDPCLFDPAEPDPFINAIFEPVYQQFQNANCSTQHPARGCNQPACCFAVCTVDPTCCSDSWDSTCANLVNSGQFVSCVIPEPTGDASPDLTVQQTAQGLQGFQYYTQSGPRPADLVDVAGVGTTWVGAIGGGPLGFSGQGFALQEFEDFQQLMWEFYQGGDPAANPFLGGGGIRIGVLETSGYAMHEEFILAGPAKNPQRPWEGPLLAEPRVISEPGVTPIYAENGPISANHGTNVMGVILSADNGFGVTGMAPNAQGYLFPIISAESGFRAQDAFTSALSVFTSGDVLNFSWGFAAAVPTFPYHPTSTGQLTVQPVTSDAAFSALIGVASDLGITSVVAAGVGPTEIQGSGSEVDVGAIIVTAVWPGNMLEGTSPLPGYECCSVDLTEENLSIIRYSKSNFDPEDVENEDESADLSAWGFGVVTTGATTLYDNTTVPNPETFLFEGTNDQPPSSVPGLQVDRLRNYTQSFGGTSAAAAMISAIVARTQAAARQFYGISLSPTQVRGILQSTPSAYIQCPWAVRGENPPSSDFPFQQAVPADSCTPPGPCSDECVPAGCTCDFSPIGLPPNLQQLGGTILGADLFDGNTTTVEVITGGQLIGYSWNPFQIKALDNNYLRVVAQPRTAGTTVQGLTYMSTGRTTDVLVEKEVVLPDPTKSVNSIGLTLVSRATRNFVFCGVFIYNNDSGRYEFFGAQFLNVAADALAFPLPPVGAFAPYINGSTNTIKMRVWTCGIGAVGRHTVEHDFIDIVINDPQQPL